MSNRDDELLRGTSLEEEGIPELEDQPTGKVLSGDTSEGVVPPRDYPLAADEFGTTPGEEARGESLAQRMAREEADLGGEVLVADEDDEGAGRVVQPDLGMLDADDIPEEVGDRTDEVTGLSAEESAIRVEEDPAGMGGGWPGYLDENQD